MKKNKFLGVAALIPLVLSNFAAMPVYAEVTDYQEADTSAEETSAECQVIYKSTYDFSEEIPKYPELEVTASGYEGVYDGKPHGITVVCKTEGVTILYSTDGKTYTSEKPVYTDVGTYVVYYKVEKEGYATVTGSAMVKIKEAMIDFNASGYEGVYDGKPHGITADCKTEGVTILYSTDGKTYTAKKPTYEDVGNYEVYYKLEKEGYTTVTGSAMVKIKEAKIDFKVSDYEGVYDGKKHSIDVSVKINGCKILYSEDGINFTSKKPEYKEPGTYVVYYKIIKDNYEMVTGSSTVTIKYAGTDKDFEIKIPSTNGTVEVGGTISFVVDTGDKDFDVSVSDPSIVKVSVKRDVVIVTGLKEGTATITITSNGKSVQYKVTVVGIGHGNTATINNSSNNKNNNTDTISNVQTGDGSNILVYVAALIASIFGLVKSKKRKETEKL